MNFPVAISHLSVDNDSFIGSKIGIALNLCIVQCHILVDNEYRIFLGSEVKDSSKMKTNNIINHLSPLCMTIHGLYCR